MSEPLASDTKTFYLILIVVSVFVLLARFIGNLIFSIIGILYCMNRANKYEKEILK